MGVDRGHGPLLRLPLPPVDVVAALLEADWPPAVLEVVGVADLCKVVAFGSFGVVSWRGGGPGGGSRVGRGRIARLGCGQATMAARAAWLRVLADRGDGRAEAPGYITYPVCVLVDGDGVRGRRVLLAGSVVVLLPLPSYSG